MYVREECGVHLNLSDECWTEGEQLYHLAHALSSGIRYRNSFTSSKYCYCGILILSIYYFIYVCTAKQLLSTRQVRSEYRSWYQFVRQFRLALLRINQTVTARMLNFTLSVSMCTSWKWFSRYSIDFLNSTSSNNLLTVACAPQSVYFIRIRTVSVTES